MAWNRDVGQVAQGLHHRPVALHDPHVGRRTAQPLLHATRERFELGHQCCRVCSRLHPRDHARPEAARARIVAERAELAEIRKSRDELAECTKTCSCQLFERDVDVPFCRDRFPGLKAPRTFPCEARP